MNGGKITRRTTLQWVSAAIASSRVPCYVLAAVPKGVIPTATKGYGSDPDLNNPSVPWKRTMTEHQLQLTALLADIVLPATATAPAPSALGVADFVDEWISAPYPEQRADRSIILEGLAWTDAESNRRWGRSFAGTDGQKQKRMLDAMSGPAAETVIAGSFFRRFRFVVVGGYYSTPEGSKDLGYIGNVPLSSYPSITEAESAILDAELRKLGI